jgi:WD40 repeat protein
MVVKNKDTMKLGTEVPKDDISYKGLNPYSEADADKFFGRTNDIQRIVNSILAWRLTVLYGESGVGKSSVLRAGAIHALREEAKQNLENYGVPKLAAVVFPALEGTYSSWQGNPLENLIKHIEQEITKEMGNIFFPIRIPESKLSLVETLKAWTEVLGGEEFDGWLLIVLDQFEEYFQYHPQEESGGGFITEIAKVLNQPNLHVNFLISLREDFYVNLNRLRGHIPKILDFCLHIEHLNKQEAEEAIKKPVEQYNQKVAPSQSVEIKPELVEVLLKAIPQARMTGEKARGGGGLDKLQSIWEGQISAPYLQLLMTRLWHEMEKNESHCLSLQTLTSLGDNKALNEKDKIKTAIDNIIKQYIIKQMEALSDREKEIAAKSFQHLVKHSKNNSIDNLAKLVNCDKKKLQDLLEKLAQSNPPVVRGIPSLDLPNVVSYEFFHDFLALAFFNWGREYIEKKQSKTRRRRRIILFSSLGILLFLSGYGLCKTIYDDSLKSLAQKTSQAEIDFNNGNQLSALQVLVKLEQDILIRNDWISQILFSSNQKQTLDQKVNWTFQKILNEIQQVNQFDPPNKSSSNTFSLSPNGKTLAIVLSDGTVQLWDWQKPTQQPSSPFQAGSSPLSLSFSPDGQTLAILLQDGTVQLWDWQKPTQQTLPLPKGNIPSSLSFSPDSQTLAIVLSDGTVQLWDWQKPTQQPLPLPKGNIPSSLSFSTDGQTLAILLQDGTVQLWDWQNPTQQPSPSFQAGSSPLSLSFSPDSQTLAILLQDGTVQLWDWQKPTQQPSSPFQAGSSPLSLSFSPDDQTLAILLQDGTVQLWDWQKPTQQPSSSFQAGSSPLSLSFSPNGQTLAILLQDGTVQLWDWQNSQELVNLKASGSVSSFSFSPDGKTLTIASTKKYSVFVETPIENINLKDMRNQGCKKLQPYLDSHSDKKKELGCD